MENLDFDTGLVTFNVNGVTQVSFNPTDSNFAERLYSAFEELDKKQESHRSQIEKMADKKEIFEFSRERDNEMRNIIDSVLGAPVSAALFGTMNVYALAGGLPVWANLMLAVMDKMDSAFIQEKKLTDARVKKYTDKYKK